MADQEIDKLLLEINVEDKTQGGSEKLVESIATAVSKLNAEIAKLDTSKLENVTKALSAIGGGVGGTAKGGAVAKKSAELKQAEKELKALEKSYNEFVNAEMKPEALAMVSEQCGLDKARERVEELRNLEAPQAQGGNTQQISENIQNATANTQKLNTLTDIQRAKLNIIRKQLEDKNLSEEEYIKLKEKELRLEKFMKGTGEKNLLSAIKRVAVYRLIRGALKAVLNAFKEGFTNLAGYSKEVNNTLSQLTSSFTVMKNSVAVAFLPLLNIITPVIQRISVSIANLANVISYLTAKLQGNATYLKVNTEYFKKFNEQSRLLSFDTFEKLGNGVDYSDMFEEANIADGFDNSKLTEALTILTAISATLITIGGSKLIKGLSNGVLKTKISDISGALSTVKGQIGAMAVGIGLLTAGIASLVTNWNDVNFETWEKGVTIAFALAGAVVGVYVALKALHLPIATAIGLGMALAGTIALIGTTIGKNSPKNYAFGGGYNSADLFYANENGKTELVASTNSGGGAVMNMQQLESAIYSGMVKAMASGQNGESAIYLDGNKVGTFIAGNNGFRSEANRRNTGLNWR